MRPGEIKHAKDCVVLANEIDNFIRSAGDKNKTALQRGFLLRRIERFMLRLAQLLYVGNIITTALSSQELSERSTRLEPLFRAAKRLQAFDEACHSSSSDKGEIDKRASVFSPENLDEEELLHYQILLDEAGDPVFAVAGQAKETFTTTPCGDFYDLILTFCNMMEGMAAAEEQMLEEGLAGRDKTAIVATYKKAIDF